MPAEQLEPLGGSARRQSGITVTAMSARELVEIERARRMVLEHVDQLSATEIELNDALGRILAEDVVSEQPVPEFDNSAMDGFAVRSADLAAADDDAPVTLAVVGESRAGKPSDRELRAGEAIGISTGAMLPRGADAVVRIESVIARDGVVEVRASTPRGCQVRRAGEDVEPGERVLAGGTALGPAELGVLASLGRATVLCSRRPRISLRVTGDELISPGDPTRPGGVRDTSTYALGALARIAGAEVVSSEVVPDDPGPTKLALEAAFEGSDAVVVCGGVSVGRHDHVKAALRSLGAREVFWGVALKPGRPTWFGTLGERPVFGLPGNPVSAIVTFILLALPALRRMQGAAPLERRWSAILDRDYEKAPGRAHAVRCRLRALEDGLHVEPTGAQGSHVLTSMLGADVLAIIPTDAASVRAGERVAIEPLNLLQGAPI